MLRGGLGGAGGAAGGTTTSSSLDDDFSDEEDDDAGSDGGRKVNVSLPTFAPFDDSQEDTDDSKTSGSSVTSSSSDEPSRINLLSDSDTFGSESRTTSVTDNTNKNEFNLVR